MLSTGEKCFSNFSCVYVCGMFLCCLSLMVGILKCRSDEGAFRPELNQCSLILYRLISQSPDFSQQTETKGTTFPTECPTYTLAFIGGVHK